MLKTMKNYFSLLVIVAWVFLPVCATLKGGGLVLDTVGPPLPQPTAAIATNGTLLVYSAYEAGPAFNARDPNRPEYSDYKIFTAAGRLLQRVRNNSESIRQDAVPVALPPGKYNVVALANGLGDVTVPVMIAARQSTVLHLEGGGFWPDELASSQTDAVRLPDGRIIGWKAMPGL